MEKEPRRKGVNIRFLLMLCMKNPRISAGACIVLEISFIFAQSTKLHDKNGDYPGISLRIFRILAISQNFRRFYILKFRQKKAEKTAWFFMRRTVFPVFPYAPETRKMTEKFHAGKTG